MRKFNLLLIAGIMAMSLASCSSVEPGPENKPLSPSDQGTYMINTASALVDQIEAKDFQPVVDLVKNYQDINFLVLIGKNPELFSQFFTILDKMLLPDSTGYLIDLPPFNGKYILSRDSIITFEAADNIQIVDNYSSQSYTLTLDYSGDTHIIPISTGKMDEMSFYAKLPENLSLNLTCDGKSIASIILNTKATFQQGSLDKFDSSKDEIAITGSANICGYTLNIADASIKDNRANISASLKKSNLNLLDLSFKLNNLVISGSEVKNMGDANATLTILDVMRVKAATPSFLAVVALAQQFSQTVNPSQKDAQEYADAFNQLFEASLYYGSDVEQSKLFLTPYYSTLSEKWIFIPGVRIGDKEYTLSSYEGFFTDAQVQNLLAKIMNLAIEFSQLFFKL